VYAKPAYKRAYEKKAAKLAKSRTTYYGYMKLTNSKTPDLIVRQKVRTSYDWEL